MAFVTPVVEHWLEWEIAQWVHHEGSSDDPSQNERTLLPRSYISLLSRTEEPLQQLALDAHVKHSDLTWPDLTWPVCDDLHSLVPRGWSWCRSSRWYSPPSPRCVPSTPSCAAVWGPAKPAGSLKQTQGIVLINDALNTFYLLCGIRHVVKDHSDSERGHPLLPHGLLFLISSKGSFICIIPQTG